jgi:hypothetical protein
MGVVVLKDRSSFPGVLATARIEALIARAFLIPSSLSFLNSSAAYCFSIAASDAGGVWVSAAIGSTSREHWIRISRSVSEEGSEGDGSDPSTDEAADGRASSTSGGRDTPDSAVSCSLILLLYGSIVPSSTT